MQGLRSGYENGWFAVQSPLLLEAAIAGLEGGQRPSRGQLGQAVHLTQSTITLIGCSRPPVQTGVHRIHTKTQRQLIVLL